MPDLKQIQRRQTERARGWILRFLSEAYPQPLELHELQKLLDQANFPFTKRGLAAQADYLRTSGLVRVFPRDAEQELDNVGQAKLLQRYAESEGELETALAARLTKNGVDFQEGRLEHEGVSRVD
jgi:hypothetical protein